MVSLWVDKTTCSAVMILMILPLKLVLWDQQKKKKSPIFSSPSWAGVDWCIIKITEWWWERRSLKIFPWWFSFAFLKSNFSRFLYCTLLIASYWGQRVCVKFMGDRIWYGVCGFVSGNEKSKRTQMKSQALRLDKILQATEPVSFVTQSRWLLSISEAKLLF